jgi:hypothetical protein
VKLSFAQWVQILVLAVTMAAGWTTLKVGQSNNTADITSLREQLRQIRQDYLRRDVDTQHDAAFDVSMADVKARMDRLELRMDRGK